MIKFKGRKNQKGISLMAILIMMAGFMLLSAIAIKNNLVTEKASGTFRDSDLAFQAAESALRAGELAAMNLVGPSDGTSNCTGGICYLGNNNWTLSGISADLNGMTIQQAVFVNGTVGLIESVGVNVTAINTSNVGSKGTGIKTAGIMPTLASPPRYVIEVVPSSRAGEDTQKSMYMYRVTAKGWGVSQKSQTVLQSVYFQPQ